MIQVLPARFGGGLNLVDSPETMGEDEARTLSGWRFTGAGRVATRRSLREMSTLVGSVVGVFPYAHEAGVGGVVLTWDTSDGSSANWNVRLYTVDGSGGSPTFVGLLDGWDAGVTTRPNVVAATLYRVIFFADEDKNLGLTYYDPNDVLGSGAMNGLFQPTFNFRTGDSNTPAAAVLKCRGVAEHANALLVWGYGDEADGDRPEYLRWSYLGFENDGTGAGDAGYQDDNSTVTSAGSQFMFDREDATMVGQRHTPIIAIASGDGRAVIATAQKAFALFGTDRDTYQIDEIDNQRGCVATRAMCEAHGAIYWMSPLGPCRYVGGQVQDIGRRVRPRLAEMEMASVFAEHSAEDHTVRFYYTLATDAGQGANRVLVFDYYAEAWSEDELPLRVSCAGRVRPSGAEGPSAAPSGLDHDQLTTNSARAFWTNGDTSPGAYTKVYRAPDSTGSPGTYTLVATLGSGLSSYTHSGLSPSTTYWTKVEHVRNGTTSSADEDDFTTNAPSTVAAPRDFVATDDPVFDSKYGVWSPSALLYWTNGQSNVRTEIERKTGSGGTYAVVADRDIDITSWRDYSVAAGTTYYYRARHKASDGTYSAYAAEVNVTITAGGT